MSLFKLINYWLFLLNSDFWTYSLDLTTNMYISVL